MFYTLLQSATFAPADLPVIKASLARLVIAAGKALYRDIKPSVANFSQWSHIDALMALR